MIRSLLHLTLSALVLSISFLTHAQNPENENDNNYDLVFLLGEDFEELNNSSNTEAFDAYLANSVQNPSDIYWAADDVYTKTSNYRLYKKHSDRSLSPVYPKDFLEGLANNQVFRNKVSNIIVEPELQSCIEELSLGDDEDILAFINSPIDFGTLVFCKSLNGGLILPPTNDETGGILDLISTSEDLEFAPIPKDDPYCSEAEIVDNYCYLSYNPQEVKLTYSQLLANKNYEVLYVKMYADIVDQNPASNNLLRRPCLIGNLYKQTDNVHINRAFILYFRIRAGITRNYTNRPRPTNLCASANQTLFLIDGKLDKSIKSYNEYTNQELKQSFKRSEERLKTALNDLESEEIQIYNKENIEKYIFCQKLKSEVGDVWYQDIDANKYAVVVKEIEPCDNHLLYYYRLTSRYPIGLNLLKESRLFQQYSDAKSHYYAALDELQHTYGVTSNFDIQSTFSEDQITQLSNPHSTKVRSTLIKYTPIDIQGSGALKYYSTNTFDRATFNRHLSHKINKINGFLNDLNAIEYLDPDVVSTVTDDEIMINALDSDMAGFVTITIELPEIRVPPIRDILSDFLESVAEAIDTAMQPVVELLRAGADGVSDLTTFVEGHTSSFEKWLRRDAASDIEENLLKGIAWVFCGGKQPSGEEGECVEMGVECTTTNEGGSNNTKCRLTDTSGVPSDVPDNNQEQISAEALQWMRETEMEDILSDPEFNTGMRQWIVDGLAREAIVRMLSVKHSEIKEKIARGQEDINGPELGVEASDHKILIDMITNGATGSERALVELVDSLINIADTVDDVKAIFNVIADQGATNFIGALGDAASEYWAEFQSSEPESQSEMIGYVATQAALTFTTVPGIISKIKNIQLVRHGASASKLGTATNLIFRNAKALNLTAKYQVDDFVQWMGDTKFILNNDIGSLGHLYKAPPAYPKGFPGLILSKKRKTPVQGGGGLRKRWHDNKKRIYEWDSKKGTIEKYDKQGKHLGEFNAETGELLNGPISTRRVEKL